MSRVPLHDSGGKDRLPVGLHDATGVNKLQHPAFPRCGAHGVSGCSTPEAPKRRWLLEFIARHFGGLYRGFEH